ncbi:MAG: hypothetical protein H7X95_00445, partial [Deltaproteobacteria bacterium]|nr:hypothetical protein [Deltaproteobacteria bacterium]
MTADNKPKNQPTSTRLSPRAHEHNPMLRPARMTRVHAVLTAGIACWIAGGCGGPSGQFYVVQNQVAGSGCIIPSGKSALYQGEGILDVRVPATSDAAYLLFPLLQNDLPSESESGVEPNRIAVAGFEVDVRFVDGPMAVQDLFAAIAADPSAAALVRYQTAWSGSIDPGGGTISAVTNAFPAETARRLRDSNVLSDGASARVNALVRGVGNKLGGRIKSDVFTYPIRVCDG